MNRSEPSPDRVLLLAFVERHWRELTLREARSLCVEHIDIFTQSVPSINGSLTCR
jgi:hypothetical protein